MKRPACLLPLVLLLLLVSCSTPQKYAYFSDVPRGKEFPIEQTYSATIFAGDQLYIDVYSQTPESTLPFNQSAVKSDDARFMRDTLHATNTRGYLVGSDGSMIFPLLGVLQVEGLTLDSLSHMIERRLKEGHYVDDALVTVKLMNFRVTVIGEVQRPSQLHSDGTRLTIFEALAQCGDVTMDGMRTNVVVVRKGLNGEVVDSVDLTRPEALNSPYYYLQQNDIVFVQPTEKKRKTAYRNEDWPTYLNFGVQAVRFAYTTIYRWFIDPTIKQYLQNQ
ncbi:MAG: polysaccharide biosynthesis/export family protein [Bacteroidales bacterium]|nr:polysaccharide biosynthesis/export family protein [Bacteroidales bacterium]